MDTKSAEWAPAAKKALEWFIECMGEVDWQERRKKVTYYFRNLKDKIYAEKEVQSGQFDKLYDPLAVYSDWIGWYMYLVECVFERPVCAEPFQSARVFPFFATIGKNVEALKAMPGIHGRMKVIFNEKQNKPDSTLFELAIACLYHKNGWLVEFLPEDVTNKTPDLRVHRGSEEYYVECKRLAKVNDYAEKERSEWQKRVKHLFNAMQILKLNAFAEIIFKVPVEDTIEIVLGAAFTRYVKSGGLAAGTILSNEQMEIRARIIDLTEINVRIVDNPVRLNSPEMINTVAGEFDFHGSYTQLIAPSRIDTIGPEDELFVLNDFVGGVHQAYMAKWECIAAESIEQKSKDVKKIMSKAMSQIPKTGKGIIHIGFETVLGPSVEVKRQQKIDASIRGFDFGSIHIESVFCNALQLLPTLDGFECAETTMYYQRQPDSILKSKLILDLPGTEERDSTHWFEDLANKSL